MEGGGGGRERWRLLQRQQEEKCVLTLHAWVHITTVPTLEEHRPTNQTKPAMALPRQNKIGWHNNLFSHFLALCHNHICVEDKGDYDPDQTH